MKNAIVAISFAKTDSQPRKMRLSPGNNLSRQRGEDLGRERHERVALSGDDIRARRGDGRACFSSFGRRWAVGKKGKSHGTTFKSTAKNREDAISGESLQWGRRRQGSCSRGIRRGWRRRARIRGRG